MERIIYALYEFLILFKVVYDHLKKLKKNDFSKNNILFWNCLSIQGFIKDPIVVKIKSVKFYYYKELLLTFFNSEKQ